MQDLLSPRLKICPSVNMRHPKRSSNVGVASLILGVVGFVFCWLPQVAIFTIALSGLGLLLGVVGFSLAIAGSDAGTGYPIVGSVVCGLALVIGAIQVKLVQAPAGAMVQRLSPESHGKQESISPNRKVAPPPLPAESLKASNTAQSESTGSEQASEAKKNNKKTISDSERDLEVFGAYELASKYDTNEVAADERFKERRFIVSGEVEAVKKSVISGSYVILKGSGLLRNVQCFFDESANASLATLSPGQKISIIGTCSGLMGNVNLKNCAMTQYVPAYWGGSVRKGTASNSESPSGFLDSLFGDKRYLVADGRYLTADEIAAEPIIDHQADGNTEAEVKFEQPPAEAPDKKPVQAAEEAKYRTWTSANGKFTVEAKLLSYANGTVTIETHANKKIKVSLKKLSMIDQDFVTKWRLQRQH